MDQKELNLNTQKIPKLRGKTMRILLSTILLTICTGCVTAGGYDKPGHDHDKPDPGGTNNNFEERVIPDEIRDKLGLKPNDMLIGMSHNKTILYVSDKFKSKTPDKNNEKESPLGKTLASEVRIFETHNSPSCFWYRDGWGNQRFWPVPDCPH